MRGRIPSLILVQSARYFRFFYMIPEILTALATDSCESSFFPSKMRRFLGFQMAQHKTTISSSDFLLIFLSISCKALSISWWSSSKDCILPNFSSTFQPTSVAKDKTFLFQRFWTVGSSCKYICENKNIYCVIIYAMLYIYENFLVKHSTYLGVITQPIFLLS